MRLTRIIINFNNVICMLTGPGLALKGAVFPNHGVLRRDPSVIGEDEDALYCVTDDVTCCGTPPTPDCCVTPSSRTGNGGSGNRQGDWYFPNGIQLSSGTDNGNLWYARWLTGAVLMNFRGTATTGTTALHRCDIQDSAGTLHHFYTCIYAEEEHIFLCKSTTSYTDTLHQLYICVMTALWHICVMTALWHF